LLLLILRPEANYRSSVYC